MYILFAFDCIYLESSEKESQQLQECWCVLLGPDVKTNKSEIVSSIVVH